MPAGSAGRAADLADAVDAGRGDLPLLLAGAAITRRLRSRRSGRSRRRAAQRRRESPRRPGAHHDCKPCEAHDHAAAAQSDDRRVPARRQARDAQRGHGPSDRFQPRRISAASAKSRAAFAAAPARRRRSPSPTPSKQNRKDRPRRSGSKDAAARGNKPCGPARTRTAAMNAARLARQRLPRAKRWPPGPRRPKGPRRPTPGRPAARRALRTQRRAPWQQPPGRNDEHQALAAKNQNSQRHWALCANTPHQRPNTVATPQTLVTRPNTRAKRRCGNIAPIAAKQAPTIQPREPCTARPITRTTMLGATALSAQPDAVTRRPHHGAAQAERRRQPRRGRAGEHRAHHVGRVAQLK